MRFLGCCLLALALFFFSLLLLLFFSFFFSWLKLETIYTNVSRVAPVPRFEPERQGQTGDRRRPFSDVNTRLRRHRQKLSV